MIKETLVSDAGPHIACEGCGSFVSLTLAKAFGNERFLTCPTCQLVRRWEAVEETRQAASESEPEVSPPLNQPSGGR